MNNQALLAKADHLARMVCKLLRDDIKGDRQPITHEEQRRLVQWASEWLQAYHMIDRKP